MATTYELEIQAQPGIYDPKDRTMHLFFAEPEAGANKDTGLLLICAGYGGSAASNVYAKMRTLFADAYNLITVQCDYFGYEYMQQDFENEISEAELQKALSDAELMLLQKDYDKYKHILQGKIFQHPVELNETPSSFNDMGLMQAMDNLRAVKVVLDITKSNGIAINENRIYAYGFSHGGYLTYLCNALCPGLFTSIVENSSYLSPYFLSHERNLYITEDGIQVNHLINYKAAEFVQDTEILILPKLYAQFENHARIICYAGETDYMTTLEDKKAFLNQVEHTIVETITKSRVDMVRFKSTGHGCGADFIELFHHAYKNYIEPEEIKRKKSRKKEERPITYPEVCYQTDMFWYEVKWENGIPVLYRLAK